MSWKWFVKQGERIDGPFTSDDVTKRLGNGSFSRHDLIWGPGNEAWQNLQSWQASLNSIGGDQEQTQVTVIESWHFAVDGQSKGPFTREQLLKQLKGLNGDIMLWTKGMKEWAPLYEFHDFMTELGINKRQFPRAEVTGKAVIKSTGSTLVAPLLSISEGGFGVEMDGGLVPGESVTVELQTSAFREAISAKAEVRYQGVGVMGFKFTQLNVETRGAIIQFIKTNQVRFPLKGAA